MRSVIKYLHMKSKTPLQIFNEMKDTYGDNGPSVFVIQYWVRKFKFGFPSVQDDVRPGRPADAVTDYCKGWIFSAHELFLFCRVKLFATWIFREWAIITHSVNS